MILPMTSGAAWKVFGYDGKFIGAYTNEQLAEAINAKGAPLTSEEFDNLFAVHETKADAQTEEIRGGVPENS